MSKQSHTRRARPGWTFVVVSVALFMITLDNLVVTTALPSIRRDLGASLDSLEWTVNAYTLSFAVLLVTGGRLGDIFGRRRVFLFGVVLFALSSGFIGLAQSDEWLVAWHSRDDGSENGTVWIVRTVGKRAGD